MNTLRRVSLAISLIAICHPAGATTESLGSGAEGWFTRGGITASFMTLDGYTTNGTVGTGEPIQNGPYAGRPDGFLLDEEGDDLTATVEIGVGRDFGAWSVIFDYQYRYRTDLDVLAFTASLDRPSQFHNNIATHLVEANLIRRFDTTWWGFRPYVGAGAGVVWNVSDSDFIVRELPGQIPETTTNEENTTTDFSWNVQLGATKQMTERMALDLRYRFVTLGKVENGPYPDSPAEIETEDGIYANEIMIGINYRL